MELKYARLTETHLVATADYHTAGLRIDEGGLGQGVNALATLAVDYLDAAPAEQK